MNLIKAVGEIKQRNHINYFGFAPISRFENASPTHRPTDFLPGVTSFVYVDKTVWIPK